MLGLLRSYGLHWSLDAAGLARLWSFEQTLAEAPDHNEALLARILAENAETAFGRAHGFSSLRTPSDFSRAVPLCDYEALRPLVDRIAQGEREVLTREPVRYLGVTSGTTGRGKLVPMTAGAQRSIILHMVLTTRGVIARHVAGRRPGPGLLLMSSVLPKTTPGGIPVGTATAAGLDRMGNMARQLWSSPLPVYRVSSFPAALHLHLLYALARRDLSFLSAPFASSLVDLLRALEAEGTALVDELAAGRLPAELAIEPELRAQLPLQADAERAREVADELARGMEGIVPRLWPRARYVMGVHTGSFAVYREPLRRAIGELPAYSGLYACSEGLLGLAVEPDSDRYVLDPSSLYFELIPLEQCERAKPQVLTLREAERGERYELVLTTRSGLYRYRLGDVIHVVDWKGRAPVVEFSHRRGMLLDVASEKTSEPVMRDAVLEAARTWRARLVDFTTRADYAATPSRYEIYVEVEAPAALDRERDPSRPLDAALATANPGYQLLRATGRLGAPALHRVRAGTFDALKALLTAQGASAAQVKVPRVLLRDDLYQLVASRVERTFDTTGVNQA